MSRHSGRRAGGIGLVVTLGIALGYVVLSDIPLRSPVMFHKLSSVTIPTRLGLTRGGAINEDSQAFSSLQSFGYIGENDEIPFASPAFEAYSIDGEVFLLRRSSESALELYDMREGTRIVLPFSGRPFQQNGRIFILRDDQRAVTEINRAGTVLWSQEFGSIIVAGSAGKAGSAWGLLDGTSAVITSDGENVARINPQEHGITSSRRSVYALAVSPDGNFLAMLYGLDAQEFLVFERKNSGFMLRHRRKLESAVVSPQSASFSSDGSWCAVMSADGVLVYGARDNKSSLMGTQAAKPRDSAMVVSGADTIGILLRSEEGAWLLSLRQGRLLARIPLPAATSGIQASGDGMNLSDGKSVYRFVFEGGPR